MAGNYLASSLSLDPAGFSRPGHWPWGHPPKTRQVTHRVYDGTLLSPTVRSTIAVLVTQNPRPLPLHNSVFLCGAVLTPPEQSWWAAGSRCCSPCREVQRCPSQCCPQWPSPPQSNAELSRAASEGATTARSCPAELPDTLEFPSWPEPHSQLRNQLSCWLWEPLDNVQSIPLLLESAGAVSLPFKNPRWYSGAVLVFSGFIDLFGLFFFFLIFIPPSEVSG